MSLVLVCLGNSERGLPSDSASQLALYLTMSKANLKVAKQDTFHRDNLVFIHVWSLGQTINSVVHIPSLHIE